MYVPPNRYPDQLVRTSYDATLLARLIETLPLGTPVAVDTETTGVHVYEGDVLRGVSLAFRTALDDVEQVVGTLHSFYIPVGYPDPLDNLGTYDVQTVFTALMAREPFLVLHHGKFDFAFLRQLPTGRSGEVFFTVPSPERWWDTQKVAWLLDENMPKGLKAQAALHWGYDEKAEAEALKARRVELCKAAGIKTTKDYGWELLTADDTAAYAAMDAEQTLRLYELQQGFVDGQAPILGVVRPALTREFAVEALLGRMQRTGILVDAAEIERLRTADEAAAAEIEAHFKALDIDTVPVTPEYTVPKGGVNIGSPKQLAAYLYDGLGLKCPRSTQSGARSVDRAALESLERTPEVQMLLDHRRHTKAASFCKQLQERIGLDGRIHAHFNSCGTVTGRFSCSEPNLQTIPRADTLKGVRAVFVAEPGMELWGFDLAAAEMRVMAGMANEPGLIERLEDPEGDVHGALAAQVFGDDYTGLQRRYAKNVGYGWNYGLSSPVTASKYIGGPDALSIAVKILDGLKVLYPNIGRLMRSTTSRFEKHGYLPIHDTAWPGRYRRLVTPAKIKPAAFTGLNAQIQGGIGEFMKDMMLEGEEPLAQLGARICLQVHDELVCEVQPGTGPAVLELLQELADKINPFAMRMVFTGAPWSEHG